MSLRAGFCIRFLRSEQDDVRATKSPYEMKNKRHSRVRGCLRTPWRVGRGGKVGDSHRLGTEPDDGA